MSDAPNEPSDVSSDDIPEMDQNEINALLSAASEQIAPSGESPGAPADEPLADDADGATRTNPGASAETPASAGDDILGADPGGLAAANDALSEENASVEGIVGSQIAAEGFELPDFDPTTPVEAEPSRVSMLHDVNLRVKIELGRTRMLVEDVLRLKEGSVVELDKLAGDPVDVVVNDRLVARGEVLVLNDNFCVRVSEVVANDPHRVIA